MKALERARTLLKQSIDEFGRNTPNATIQQLNAIFELTRNLETYIERQNDSEDERFVERDAPIKKKRSSKKATSKRSHTRRSSRTDKT